jgi:lipoate-protein ligase A
MGEIFMLFIDSHITNPYFNLAMEEYLLKSFNKDIFILWRNEPAIIVGKNQNTISEVNVEYVKENSIPVVRRLTGGGAVFHDLGNINFTFISANDNKSFNNFRKFTQPIIDVLRSLEVEAEFSGRNDLVIQGRKFSGNAQCNYKDKVMHHGTLLFSSAIKDLSAALKVKPSKFEGKAVKSVASRVTNISEHLKSTLSIIQFKEMVMDHVAKEKESGVVYKFSEEDIKNINKLVEEKYSTWQWNFGNSPKYSFTNEFKYNGGNVEVRLNVDKGLIKDIKIYGDFFGKCDVSEIENALIGVRHCEIGIRKVLRNFEIDNYFLGGNEDVLVDGFIGIKVK